MARTLAKTNGKFMLLSALGIIMVVDAHSCNALNMFTDFMPYNSFFMPLFVFISGYFNKVDSKTNLFEYFKRKLLHLILPYVLISLITAVLGFFIDWIKRGEHKSLLDEDLIINSLTRAMLSGEVVAISSPLWFVPTLFGVLVIYALIKKILVKWNSSLAFILFCLINIFVVCLCKTTDYSIWLLPLLKCLFFLPFIEFGVLYREKIEKKTEKFKFGINILVLSSLALINTVRMILLPKPNDIQFLDISTLSGFSSPYYTTPLVSSIIGIVFWVTLVEMIGSGIYENKIINYISNNTFFIMGFHLLFMNMINIVLAYINLNMIKLPEFDINAYQESYWYRWYHWSFFSIVYFFAGLTGPLVLKYLFDRIKTMILGFVKTRKAI